MTLTDDDRASLIAQARELARHGSRMAWLLCVLAAKDDVILGLSDRVEAQSQLSDRVEAQSQLLAKRAEAKA